MAKLPDMSDSVVYVHPTAICKARDIGKGTRIWAYAHVLDGAVIGRACNICDQVYIEGGARIGDRVVVKNRVMIWDGVTIESDVFIGPGVIFTNDSHPRSRRLAEAAPRYAHRENWLIPTYVGRGASLGAGAVILPGATIGRFASIGAGAVVTHEVPDHRIVAGNPAREIGWVCMCGLPLTHKLTCRRCGRTFKVSDAALVAVKNRHVEASNNHRTGPRVQRGRPREAGRRARPCGCCGTDHLGF